MKIAVTVTDCVQVGIDTWKNVGKTRVFDSSDSIDSMIEWAKSLNKAFDFNSLQMTTVGE